MATFKKHALGICMIHDCFTLELVSHQQHGQVLVDTAQPTAVYLDKLQCRGLQELLKHHPVVTLERKLNSTQLKI